MKLKYCWQIIEH